MPWGPPSSSTSPGSFAPVTGYRSGGPHRLEAGEWTDDTSMALALADSIATAGWDLNDQAEPLRPMVEDRQVFRERAMFRHRHHHQKCA